MYDSEWAPEWTGEERMWHTPTSHGTSVEVCLDTYNTGEATYWAREASPQGKGEWVELDTTYSLDEAASSALEEAWSRYIEGTLPPPGGEE